MFYDSIPCVQVLKSLDLKTAINIGVLLKVKMPQGASQSDGACEAQQTAGAPPCAFKFMVSSPPSLTLHGELFLRSASEVNR